MAVIPVTWIDAGDVDDQLGSPAFSADPAAPAIVAAANTWAYRKRKAAGYVDDPAAAAADVTLGTTLYAVALWRERASTDGYPSFEDLGSFNPTGGSSAQIRKLLGIGKAQVDSPSTLTVAQLRARRLRRAW